jgi:hypothetical protein
MGWTGTPGGTKASEIEYLENYGFKGANIEIVKRTASGNWWLFKIYPGTPEEKYVATKVIWRYSSKEREIWRKEIDLESGPDMTGFPMSWASCVDLGNKERYRYDQLETLLAMKDKSKDYIPKIGECVINYDGTAHYFTGNVPRKKLKYKYYFTNGVKTLRWTQEQANRARARFEKRCVPMVIPQAA